MVENNWFTTNLSERSAAIHIDFQIKIEPYEFVDRGFYKNCDIFKLMRDYRIKKYDYFIQKHELLHQLTKYRKT